MYAVQNVQACFGTSTTRLAYAHAVLTPVEASWNAVLSKVCITKMSPLYLV